MVQCEKPSRLPCVLYTGARGSEIFTDVEGEKDRKLGDGQSAWFEWITRGDVYEECARDRCGFQGASKHARSDGYAGHHGANLVMNSRAAAFNAAREMLTGSNPALLGRAIRHVCTRRVLRKSRVIDRARTVSTERTAFSSA